MIWQQDQELMQWLLNIHPMKAGDFLKSLAETAMRADCENYPILRPALLELKKKYPQYDVPAACDCCGRDRANCICAPATCGSPSTAPAKK